MRTQYRLIVEPKGGLLLGGTALPGVHDSTARDAEGVPYIPATALKGALREQLVRILDAAEPETASESVQRILGSAPATTIASEKTATRSGEGKERIGGGRTRVYISNALVCDPDLRTAMKAGYSGLSARHHVSIDRQSRRAAHHRLFSREVVAPFLDGLTFTADIDLTHLLCDPHHAQDDLKRLNAAVAAVFAIGGGRSAGLGHVSMKLVPEPRNEDPGNACDLEGTSAEPTPNTSKITPIPTSPSIELVLEAEEPLCLGDRLFLTNNFHASLGYIRGSTLRGALVTAAMTAQGISKDMKHDMPFARAVIDEKTCMRFGDAAPVEKTEGCEALPHVAPLTLRTCKYGGAEHGLLDTLVLRWVQERLGAQGAFLAFDEHCQHRDGAERRCAERLIMAPDRLGAAEPGRRVVTRLALDTSSGRGADRKLFSIDLLDGGTRFAVRIDRLDDYGRELLAWAQGAIIRVGHGRGQGYGRIRLVEARTVPADALESRITDFDACVRAAWRAACAYVERDADDPAPGRLFISVTLENDLVLREHDRKRLASDALLAALELDGADALFGAVRAGQRGGYDNRKDQFKSIEPVVRGRSCLLLRVPDDDAHRERLAEIEAGGLGTCRDQGYGRVRIADPLHRPAWKPTWRNPS